MSILNAGEDNYDRDADDLMQEISSNKDSLETYRSNSGNSVDFFFNPSKFTHDLNSEEKSHNNLINDKSLGSNFIKQKILKEKLEVILKNLLKAYELNKISKNNLLRNFDYLTQKQNLIEQTLEKIKRVNRTKQKKHVKYLRYIPLNKVYFYSPKKNHFYYILMDIVVKSRKKHILAIGGTIYGEEDEETERLNHSKSSLKKISTADSRINKSTLKRTINRYKFREDEDEILKKLILYSGGDYIDWHQISRDLNDFIAHVMKKNPSKTKSRSALEAYTRSLELSDFYTYKKWTNNEDQILKRAILYYGPKNWQQISYCLEGRNNSQAFHRWMKGINPKIKRSKWSFEEDLTLGIALKVYGNKKWSKIANHLVGRTDIQCRERFCNILDPSLEEVEWKAHEDAKLLLLYDRMKNKWSKIAKEFGNRTDNTCWRRWKYLESVRRSMGVNHLNTCSYNITITNNTHTLLDSYSEGGEGTFSQANQYNISVGSNKMSSKKKQKKKEIFRVRKMSKF